jgi:hypothetical protein
MELPEKLSDRIFIKIDEKNKHLANLVQDDLDEFITEIRRQIYVIFPNHTLHDLEHSDLHHIYNSIIIILTNILELCYFSDKFYKIPNNSMHSLHSVIENVFEDIGSEFDNIHDTKMQMVLTTLNSFASIKIASERNSQNRQELLTFMTASNNCCSIQKTAINIFVKGAAKDAAKDTGKYNIISKGWLYHVSSFLSDGPTPLRIKEDNS